MSDKVMGYKGFNKKLQCTPGGKIYQYEIGKEYKEEKADLCHAGFHFCENPFSLDTFRYYPPSDSRYCEVEAEGVSEQKDNDSKRCAKIIKIGAEIGIKGIIDAFVKLTLEKIDWNNNRETNTGDFSAAIVEGRDSVACALGYNCKAMGVIGSAIVIAERDNSHRLIDVKAAIVDGEKIKKNVFYKLVGGKFIEANEG